MSNGDDNQAARDATEVLDNLSYSDQNVILMAKANYFKHLLQRLSTGLFNLLSTLVDSIANPFSYKRYECNIKEHASKYQK